MKFCKVEKRTLIFLLQVLRPFRGWLIGFFVVSVLLAITTSLKPYALKQLLNFVASYQMQTDPSGTWLSALYYLLASLFTVLAFRAHNFIWINLAPPLRNYLIRRCTRDLSARPYSFFQSYSPSELAHLIQEISTKVPYLVQVIFDGFVCGSLTLLIAIITVGTIHWHFAFGLLIWIILYVIGSWLLLKHAKTLGQEGGRFRSKIFSKIAEDFANIQCIRLFVREERERKNLNNLLDPYLVLDKQKEFAVVKTYGFQGLSFLLYQAVCLIWLVRGMASGAIHLGDIALILSINIIFVDYFRKISQYMLDFADLWGSIQYAIETSLSGAELPAPVISQTPKPVPPLGSRSLLGDICLENVSFQYPGVAPLFQNLSINIREGEKVAMIGCSGSGKSTFLRLILRLYDPSSGRITIGGKNIQDIPPCALRQAIGAVPQSPSLFAGTVKENIRYGRLEATDEEVIEAARWAQIHDFIAQLPFGYDSIIDAAGLQLSSGQRQRISIARALIKKAPFLFLDEAMSHLDIATETQIQDSILQMVQGKTLLIITHRLSSFLAKMDRILIFDRGQIREQSPPVMEPRETLL